MSKILLFITFLLFVQYNWTNITEYFQEEETAVQTTTVSSNQAFDIVLLVNDNEHLHTYSPLAQMLEEMGYNDIQTILRNIRMSTFRAVKFMLIMHQLFVKSLIKTMSDHTAHLMTCAERQFTTNRFCSWTNATECYVYGLRQIII